jgi:hypothetical protein
MIENLADFGLNVGAGALALLCLFDGARRIGAHGLHRRAVLMFVLSACVCALYGGFAYQRYVDLKGSVSAAQRKPSATSVAAWSKVASPEKKEILSQTVARQTFRESGTLMPYIDKTGQTKVFAPTQDDLVAREKIVTRYTLAEAAMRTSLAEALLWLIAGVTAILLGFAMSLDKGPPKPAQDDALAGEAPLHN